MMSSKTNNHDDDDDDDNDVTKSKDLREEKLPLAIFVHFNFYFSFVIFATLIGRLVHEKYNYLFYCNTYQRSILIPIYCVWLITEISRLYLGQKGILRDCPASIASFILLSFFPQIWIAIYLAFVQEIILPFDRFLGSMMLIVVVVEVGVAWRFLRSIITRQSALFLQQQQEPRQECVAG